MSKCRHTQGDESIQLHVVLAASPQLKSLLRGIGRKDLAHKQFTWSILWNKLQGVSQKFKPEYGFVALLTGAKF